MQFHFCLLPRTGRTFATQKQNSYTLTSHPYPSGWQVGALCLSTMAMVWYQAPSFLWSIHAETELLSHKTSPCLTPQKPPNGLSSSPAACSSHFPCISHAFGYCLVALGYEVVASVAMTCIASVAMNAKLLRECFGDL